MKKTIAILITAILFLALGCSGTTIKPDNGGKTGNTVVTNTPPKIVKNPEITDKGMRFVYRLKIQPQNDLFLTGGFNGWTPNAPKFQLKKGDDGMWSVVVKIDQGRWEYKFVVDGQQFYDSFAKEIEPDETGRKKSLVTVQ